MNLDKFEELSDLIKLIFSIEKINSYSNDAYISKFFRGKVDDLRINISLSYMKSSDNINEYWSYSYEELDIKSEFIEIYKYIKITKLEEIESHLLNLKINRDEDTGYS